VPYLKINRAMPPLPHMTSCLIKHTGSFIVVDVAVVVVVVVVVV